MDKKYHKKNSTDPRFEIIIGAILTQNTEQSNVEKAIEKIKKKKKLDIKSILETDIDYLKKLIRPSGFFIKKQKDLKIFQNFYIKNTTQIQIYFLKKTKINLEKNYSA